MNTLTDSYWKQLVSEIATDNDPLLHSPGAMEKLVARLNPYIVRVAGIHGKYRVTNQCTLIDFRNDKEQSYYAGALSRYQEACAKVNRQTAEGRWAEFVAFGQFKKAAEVIRAETLAEKCNDAVKQEDKSAVVGCCYKQTIIGVVRSLIKNYGYKRNDISIIWGGDDTAQRGNRLTQIQCVQYLMQMAAGKPVTKKILKQIEKQAFESQAEQVLAAEDLGDLALGSQSLSDRQLEIDRFQTSRSRICLFTGAAGGVGLSLHHTNDLFEMRKDRYEKVDDTQYRHLKTGQLFRAYPRRTFVTPTYSAQDFVQILGRAHRSIFSLSDTLQDILFYRGTVEEEVMAIVSIKLKCLKKVTTARESWMDAIYETSVSKNRDAYLAAQKGHDPVEGEEFDLNETESDGDDEGD